MVGFSVFDAVDDVGKEQFATTSRSCEQGGARRQPRVQPLDSQGHRFWALVSHTAPARRLRRPARLDAPGERAQRPAPPPHQLGEAQRIAKIGSWEWDVDEDRVSWSDELYRIYGLDRSDLTPTYDGFLARIHPDDRDHVAQSVGSALVAGDSFEFDARVLRTNGEIAWIGGGAS